ncbi:MAG: CoA-binding protein [Gemmatimonadetes bacterium]|nr:CoA-binding protein [Gemmatimonadota bacterium]
MGGERAGHQGAQRFRERAGEDGGEGGAEREREELHIHLPGPQLHHDQGQASAVVPVLHACGRGAATAAPLLASARPQGTIFRSPQSRQEVSVSSLPAAAAEFLSHRRIAVAGVSRDQPNAANVIYRRLRADGYDVFAVNPAADQVEGDRCYRSLAAIEGSVDGVVIGTAPDATLQVLEQCTAAGVQRVWIHRGIGPGSLSAAAVRFCTEHDVSVIAGGCPMMFVQPTDFGHKCICWVLGRFGKLPDARAYRFATARGPRPEPAPDVPPPARAD